MAYQIDWSDDGALVTMKGAIEIEEINEANGRLHGDERFDTMRYQVWDMLQASLASITAREIEQPSAIDLVAGGINAKVRVALITTSPHDVRLCEHYAHRTRTLGSTWEIRVFPDLESALAWSRA